MENIKTPISKVAAALKVRSEGVSLRSTARILGSHKRTIAGWENRFADQKGTLMLYAFCHKFVSLTFEGDELYTIVGKRTDPMESKGWTAVVMDRASRFIVDQRCGKNTELNLPDSEIYANHLEGQNAATRRRNSTFRRRTNTYAKTKNGLQRTLDVQQLIHNFVRPHWTTKEVPAVSLGIINKPFTLENILSMQKAA